MPVEIKTLDGVMTAYIDGEIDHHTARDIRLEIDAQAERLRPEVLVLDFGRVSFMDSSGVGLVMGRFRLMSELGGEVRIANAGRSASKMLKLAGLERLNIKL